MLPAPSVMRSQDSNLLSRETSMLPSFLPFPDSLRSSRGSFQPKFKDPLDSKQKKPARWGAMHVCIARQIYHHKQRAMMTQMKPNNPYLGLVPEVPSGTSLTETSQQYRELVQPSCTRPNAESQVGQPQYGDLETINIIDMNGTEKPAATMSHLNNCHSSDRPHMSPPEPCHSYPAVGAAKNREKPGSEELTARHLHRDSREEKRDEKDKHRDHHLVVSPKGSPPTDILMSLRETTPDVDSGPGGRCSWESGDRKRQLPCENHMKVKRVKQERVEYDQQDSYGSEPPHQPSPSRRTVTPPTDPSSHSTLLQHKAIGGGMPALYPISSGCNVARTYSTTPIGLTSYLGPEKYAYPFPPWGPLLDVHRSVDLASQKDILESGYSLNNSDASSILDAEWWPKDREGYSGLSPPYLQPLLTLRQQESDCHRGREFLHSLRENYYYHYSQPHPLRSVPMGPPHQSGFLTTAYPGPGVFRVSLTQHRAAVSTRFTRLCP